MQAKIRALNVQIQRLNGTCRDRECSPLPNDGESSREKPKSNKKLKLSLTKREESVFLKEAAFEDLIRLSNESEKQIMCLQYDLTSAQDLNSVKSAEIDRLNQKIIRLERELMNSNQLESNPHQEIPVKVKIADSCESKESDVTTRTPGEMQAEIQELKSKLASLSQENTSKIAKIDELHVRIQKKEQQIREISTELGRQVSAASHRDCELSREVATQRTALYTAKSTVDELISKSKDLAGKLAIAEKDCVNKSVEIESLMRKLAKSEENCERKTGEIEQLLKCGQNVANANDIEVCPQTGKTQPIRSGDDKANLDVADANDIADQTEIDGKGVKLSETAKVTEDKIAEIDSVENPVEVASGKPVMKVTIDESDRDVSEVAKGDGNVAKSSDIYEEPRKSVWAHNSAIQPQVGPTKPELYRLISLKNSQLSKLQSQLDIKLFRSKFEPRENLMQSKLVGRDDSTIDVNSGSRLTSEINISDISLELKNLSVRLSGERKNVKKLMCSVSEERFQKSVLSRRLAGCDRQLEVSQKRISFNSDKLSDYEAEIKRLKSAKFECEKQIYLLEKQLKSVSDVRRSQ
eukprot:1005806_1